MLNNLNVFLLLFSGRRGDKEGCLFLGVCRIPAKSVQMFQLPHMTYSKTEYIFFKEILQATVTLYLELFLLIGKILMFTLAFNSFYFNFLISVTN